MIITNPFSGRLNLDDADFRILGKGDYIDAVNVTRDSPGEGQDTVVSNNIGNVLIPYTLPSGTNKVIGYREDKKRNRLYYFVWNSSKKHSILYYDANRNYVVKVLENMTDTGQVDILEFNPSFKITSVNILYRDFEGDLLFFSDGNTEPKVINVSAVYQVWTKQDILVIKAPPQMPPQVGYENDLFVTQNNLRNSLFQFCYRYVYDTLDKSVWSTRSIVPLPQQDTLNYTANDFKNNSRIAVSVSTGGQSVRGIEVAFRQTTAGITSDWYLIKLFDKAELNIPDNSIYSFRFYNDSVYIPLDLKETELLQDYVPLKANASELANGNALLYAGITEGFNKTNMNLIGTGFTLPLNNNYFDKCGVLFFATINGTTSGTFSYFNTEIKVYLFGTGTNNGANDVNTLNNAAGVYSINMTAGTTNISVTFTVNNASAASSSILGGLSAQLLTKNMSFVSLANNVLTVRLNNNFNTAYNTNTIILSSSGIKYLSATAEPDNTVFANAWESGYSYALQYFDESGRTIGAQTSVQATFNNPLYTLSSGIKFPITQLQIKNTPPPYAAYYQILRSNSTTYFKRLFWVTNSAFQGITINNNKFVYIGIENIATYNESISSTEKVVSYEYTKGDRIRFLARYDVNGIEQILSITKVYDYEILGTELEINSLVSNSTKKKSGVFLKINYPTSDIDINFNFPGTEDYQNYQVIIYNYEKAADKRLFFECGKYFSIGNIGQNNAFHLGLEQNQSASNPTNVPAIISLTNGDYFYRKRTVPSTLDYKLLFIQSTQFAIGYKNYSFFIQTSPVVNNNLYQINTQRANIINVSGSGFPVFSSSDYLLFNKSTTKSINVRIKFSGTATTVSDIGERIILYKILALIVSNAGVPVSPKYTIELTSLTTSFVTREFSIDTIIEIPKQSKLYIIGDYDLQYFSGIYVAVNATNIDLSVVSNQTINIIESSFSDNMNIITNSNGRASAIEENARQSYFPTMIRFGQEYQLNTIINNVNRFYPEDFDEYDLSYGEVIRLHVRDRQLIVYQNHKVGRVPILTQIIKDVSGNPLQANSDKLINKIQYYAGDYGIGDAATSLAWNNFSDYFVDNFRGIVCRLSQDGITPLSVIYKTNSFFTTKTLQYRKELNNGLTIDGNPCIYGVFDSLTNKYIVALEEINRYSNCDFNGGFCFIVPTTTTTTTTSTTTTSTTTTSTTTTTTALACKTYRNNNPVNPWTGDYQACNGTWFYNATVNEGQTICARQGTPFTRSVWGDLDMEGNC